MSNATVARYPITGMDCAKDAREIEEAAANVDGVADVRVSAATQSMTVQTQRGERLAGAGRRAPRLSTGSTRRRRTRRHATVQSPDAGLPACTVDMPLAAGAVIPYGFVLSPAMGAVLMSASTVIVALNAQLLRRLQL